jgi:cytidylate kinase
MIITLSGDPGSGKSTCAKGLAKAFSLAYYSTGDWMRQIARERKLTLESLSGIAEADSTIDHTLDERQIHLGKTQDQFIMDGRLAAHFIPHAIKIFLTADLKERAKRVFSEERALESCKTQEEMEALLLKRQQSEVKRYLAWYHFNPYELKGYDYIFDSTHKSQNALLSEMIEALRHSKLLG